MLTVDCSTFAFALCASLMLLLGCDQQTAVKPESGAPRVEETSRGAVAVKFTFAPPVVRLDRDTLLTIRTTAPTNVAVKIPPLESRVKGFTVSGSYDGAPIASDGKTIRERHVRLTPRISTEYRIAPMAVTWKEPDTGRERWFPTKPVVLDSEPLAKEPGKDPAGPQGPVWIYPGMKGFIGYTFAGLGLAALGYGAWILGRKIRRAIRLKLMSPRERALFELAELMALDLIGHDRIKEFYFELTMIVRLYIERAHAIRAPEQTTEEFMEAVSHDPRFTPDIVKKLREFMRAADLVKYAGIHPDRPTVDSALATARTYIETDAGETPS
ncbi:MAG: hypothetical protein WCO77_06910 [bacterium]